MRKGIIAFLFACFVLSAHTQDFRIACMGNSITSYKGNFVSVDPNSYPMQLRVLMGDGFNIRNFGISGTTMLKNGDYPIWEEAAFDSALAFDPQRVTILFGTNDSKPQNWGPYGEAEFYADYNAMIDTFLTLETNPEIYLCLPPPAYSSKYDITDSVIVNAIVPKIQQIADERDLPLIDFYTFFSGKPDLFYDGIHPTIEGLWEFCKVFYEDFTGNTVQEIEDVNLARGKTVMTPISVGFSPENLVDGDRTTYWAVDNGGAFTIDLGQADSLDMVQMIFHRTGQYRYTIETSPDNSTWQMLADQSQKEDTVLATVDSTGIAEAQFIRFTMNHSDPSVDSVEISEIRILRAAPVHAPVLLGSPQRESARYAYFDLTVVHHAGEGGIKYYDAEHPDSTFSAKDGYRFIADAHTESTSFLKTEEEYYYAKYYRDQYEVKTDTIRLSYDLFSAVSDPKPAAPAEFRLGQNYPNPFNPETRIRYSIPMAGRVVLKVYDMLGREVRTLADGVQAQGNHVVRFDAGDLSSGVYVVRLNVGGPTGPNFTETRKMVLMR